MPLRKNAWFALVALTLLVGCSVFRGPEPQTLVSTPEPQCDSRWYLENSQKIHLGASTPSRYKMDLNSTRCLKLADYEEQVRYVVFRLPKFRSPWILELASLMDGPRLFAPRVLLLDGDGRISRQVSGNRFSTRGHQIATNIFFKANDADERYLLIHSDPEKVGQSSTRVVTGSFYIPLVNSLFPVLYRQGTDKQVEFTLSHNGVLLLHARSTSSTTPATGLHNVGRTRTAGPMR